MKPELHVLTSSSLPNEFISTIPSAADLLAVFGRHNTTAHESNITHVRNTMKNKRNTIANEINMSNGSYNMTHEGTPWTMRVT